MKTNRLGQSDLHVAELCLGTLTFGDAADEQLCRQIVDRYQDAGGNFIDTANVYGLANAEDLLGRILEGRRHEFVIGTKSGMATQGSVKPQAGSRDQIVRGVEAALKHLRTDYLDLYQMHQPDPQTPIEETLEALDDLVRAGKIRAIGACNFAGWQAAKAFAIAGQGGLPTWSALQLQYSLASREIELEQAPLCREEGVSIIAWGPLAGGILSGKYAMGAPPGTRLADAPHTAHRINPRTQSLIDAVQKVAADTGKTPAQVALRWVLSDEVVASAIVGARTPDQIESNVAVADWSLDPEHIDALDAASRTRLPYPHDLQHMLKCQPTRTPPKGRRLQFGEIS